MLDLSQGEMTIVDEAGDKVVFPIKQRAWEAAPERERKVVPTNPKGNRFRDPHSPVLERLVYRRSVAKMALEEFLVNDRNSPIERSLVRILLKRINGVQKLRPHTTVVSMILLTSTKVAVWVFEPELVPVGACPEIHLTRCAALSRAMKTLGTAVG